MKILITTQKVDSEDDVLGFMHGWIEEFARQFEKVTVVCLYEGKHDLPENVEILSLGKDKENANKFPRPRQASLGLAISQFLLRLKYISRFYRYIWKKRKAYDVVFVHMNSEYMVLGSWLWRLMGKRTGLWFAHYRPNGIARLAFRLTQMIFTSTRKACRYDSAKVKVVGQGIDTEIFRPREDKEQKTGIRLLFLGRISPIKKIEKLIEAFGKLDNSGAKLNIIGQPGEADPARDQAYLESLKQQVRESKLEERVRFVGKVPFCNIPAHYQANDIFVNLTPTGSLDKTTLEAMASENVVLVSNQAFFEIMPEDCHDNLIFKEDDQADLERKLAMLLKLSAQERTKIGRALRQAIIAGHSLEGLINKIKNNYESDNRR